MKTFCLVVLSLLCGGCSFSRLCVEKPFVGLKTSVAETATNNGIVRILIVHGMMNHTQGYSSNFTATLAEKLRLTNAARISTPLTSAGSRTNGFLVRTDFSNQSQKRELRTYELTWTPTTQAAKQEAFAFDARLDGRRASFNKGLKAHLLNDGFGDAALYVGEGYKRKMQEPITNALWRILNDGFQPEDRFMIITHSLGSKMTFDSMNVMAGLANGSADKIAAQQIRALAGQTSYLIMFANQIPLLRLGDPMKTNAVLSERVMEQAAPVEQFINLRKQSKETRPLQIIAVTDPNDILSYPLQADDVTSDTISELELGNIFIANTPAWLGFIANPTAAHSEYFANERLIKLLLDGWHKKPRACLKPAKQPPPHP